MELSCAFPPMPDTPRYIARAEELGYARAWVFDTPALQLDVWMTLALAAERTSRIRLGPGVLIPSLRHPMVTAAAIAHLVQLAPGRVDIGVGAGFTGRNAMGQRGLRWRDVAGSVRTVQALLRGETVEVEGAPVRMLHWPGQAPDRPIEVPWKVAVGGPKGMAAARELGCGVFVSRPGPGSRFEDLPSVTAMVSGTLLQPGEAPQAERILDAVGPGIAVRYHMAYESGRREAIAEWPNGERFLELVDALDPAGRHLALHEGHLSRLNPIDRQVIDAEALALSPLLCGQEELPGWIAQFEPMGVTELAYEPFGDIEAELERFARAAGLT
ncbi:MAG: LLM class flavin-dependent oxidoreductase [Acidimicrobiia bacterium]